MVSILQQCNVLYWVSVLFMCTYLLSPFIYRYFILAVVNGFDLAKFYEGE